MLTSPICGVPCAHQTCGMAASDCLLLQEQIAFVTDQLGLLYTQHQELCQQQQEIITARIAVARLSDARARTRIQTLAQQHQALWWEIRAWSQQLRELQKDLHHLRSNPQLPCP